MFAERIWYDGKVSGRVYILGLGFRKTLAFIVFFFFFFFSLKKLFIYLYIFFNIVLTWKIVETSKASVLYIYIYID